MPVAYADIQTERPSRYLVQLCKHVSSLTGGRMHQRGLAMHADGHVASAMPADARWTETDATIDLPWGRVTVRADDGLLRLRVEAADETALRRTQDVLTDRLAGFSRRQPLTISWQQSTEGETPTRLSAVHDDAAKSRRRWPGPWAPKWLIPRRRP